MPLRARPARDRASTPTTSGRAPGSEAASVAPPASRIESVAMGAFHASTPGRVALVHDFLLDLRGAERVFEEICAMWPEADVFTAVYEEEGTEGRFAHRRIQTSFLQRLRPTERTFRALLPLYPYAVESLDLSGYDLVISSSSAWAHGVLPGE